MKRIEVEIYSEASNHAVVRMPDRRFPGAVVQGDSLSILCAEAHEISECLRLLDIQDKEILCLVQEHQEKLLARLLHYQEVLIAHGIELPYSKPARQSDFVVLMPEGRASES